MQLFFARKFLENFKLISLFEKKHFQLATIIIITYQNLEKKTKEIFPKTFVTSILILKHFFFLSLFTSQFLVDWTIWNVNWSDCYPDHHHHHQSREFFLCFFQLIFDWLNQKEREREKKNPLFFCFQKFYFLFWEIFMFHFSETFSICLCVFFLSFFFFFQFGYFHRHRRRWWW